MGKKLEALMGKGWRSWSQLKPLLNLALSRLVVLMKQRQARCSLSLSDVLQLLTQNQHERALLRVEKLIKEENMMDALVLVEGYCFLILERIHLVEQSTGECPEEVNQAVSCLIFASSRCAQFPELQDIRAIFTRHYGKEFAARAVELRNNCSVNRQLILKLSPRQPDLKSRLKRLNEIAVENNIVLHIQDITSIDLHQEEKQVEETHNNYNQSTPKETKVCLDMEELTESMKRGRQYKDVADAAQAAFESAAYAAAAARAAVELSKPQSHHYPPRDESQEIHQFNNKEIKEEDDEEKDETITSKDEGLQQNHPNLEEKEQVKKKDDEEEEDLLERKSQQEDSSEVEDLKQSSYDSIQNQTTPNSKPKTKRFFEWTRRNKNKNIK